MKEALQSKLKYKYFFATTELFENQTIIGGRFDFSFKDTFDLENRFYHEIEITKGAIDNPKLKQKTPNSTFRKRHLQREIIELYERNPYVTYKTIALQCETLILGNLNFLFTNQV